MDIQLVKGGLLSAAIFLFGVFEMQIPAARGWQHPVRNMTGSDDGISDGLNNTLPEAPRGPGLKDDLKTRCPGGMFSTKNGKCHNCSTFCPLFMYISTPCSADTDTQYSFNLEEIEDWDRNKTNATTLFWLDRDASDVNKWPFGLHITALILCFCLLILYCFQSQLYTKCMKDMKDTGVIFGRETKAEYVTLHTKPVEIEANITNPKEDISLSCSDISSDWSMEESGSTVVEINPLLKKGRVFHNSAPMLNVDFAGDPVSDEPKSVMEAGASATHISQPRESLLPNHLRANSKSGSQESSHSLSSEMHMKHPPDNNCGQTLFRSSVSSNHIPFDKGNTHDGRIQMNLSNILADSSDSESLSYSTFYIGSSQQCLTRLNQHDGTPILDKKLQYNYNSSPTPSSGGSIADDPGQEVTERTGVFSLL